MLSVRSLAVERQQLSLVVPELSDTVIPQSPHGEAHSPRPSHLSQPPQPPPPRPSWLSESPRPSRISISGNGHDPILIDKDSQLSTVEDVVHPSSTSRRVSDPEKMEPSPRYYRDKDLSVPSNGVVPPPPRDRPRNSVDASVDIESNIFQRPRWKNSSWLDDWSIHPS